MENYASYPYSRNTTKETFESDPLNSTFRWVMELTPGYPGNKVPEMTGYSKGKGPENPNKLTLLYKKLINPVLPYLIKCDLITVYEQNAALPKDLHPVILELFPHTFKAYGWLYDTPVITDYLEMYYKHYVRTGKVPPIEDRRKNVRQEFYNPELDHSKYNFRNLQELKDFCHARIEKFSRKCMETWYYKHSAFQPELFNNDISADLQHAVHTATTAEGANAAMQELLKKYPTKR
ncbi:hypothetical protein [Spirosoma aerolatum]|uniref:hypothetical protein n=1 Tax=Spirosoma aerolatum TaxID=1211326 RepID=UPI0009AF05AF|nr:hypothetical protein [Spirosoma aerolatum]